MNSNPNPAPSQVLNRRQPPIQDSVPQWTRSLAHLIRRHLYGYFQIPPRRDREQGIIPPGYLRLGIELERNQFQIDPDSLYNNKHNKQKPLQKPFTTNVTLTYKHFPTTGSEPQQIGWEIHCQDNTNLNHVTGSGQCPKALLEASKRMANDQEFFDVIARLNIWHFCKHNPEQALLKYLNHYFYATPGKPIVDAIHYHTPWTPDRPLIMPGWHQTRQLTLGLQNWAALIATENTKHRRTIGRAAFHWYKNDQLLDLSLYGSPHKPQYCDYRVSPAVGDNEEHRPKALSRNVDFIVDQIRRTRKDIKRIPDLGYWLWPRNERDFPNCNIETWQARVPTLTSPAAQKMSRDQQGLLQEIHDDLRPQVWFQANLPAELLFFKEPNPGEVFPQAPHMMKAPWV